MSVVLLRKLVFQSLVLNRLKIIVAIQKSHNTKLLCMIT